MTRGHRNTWQALVDAYYRGDGEGDPGWHVPRGGRCVLLATLWAESPELVERCDSLVPIHGGEEDMAVGYRATAVGVAYAAGNGVMPDPEIERRKELWL